MAVVLPFCHFLSMANGQWPRLVQNSRTQCSMGRQCREQHLQHSTAYGFNHLFLAAAKMPRKSKGKKKKKKSVRRQHNKGEVNHLSSCKNTNSLIQTQNKGPKFPRTSVLRYTNKEGIFDISLFCGPPCFPAVSSTTSSTTEVLFLWPDLPRSHLKIRISHHSSCLRGVF